MVVVQMGKEIGLFGESPNPSLIENGYRRPCFSPLWEEAPSDYFICLAEYEFSLCTFYQWE